MKNYSSRKAIRLLENDGWYEVACVGNHHQYKHPFKKGKVTITHPQKRYSDKNFEKHFPTVRSYI